MRPNSIRATIWLSTDWKWRLLLYVKVSELFFANLLTVDDRLLKTDPELCVYLVLKHRSAAIVLNIFN